MAMKLQASSNILDYEIQGNKVILSTFDKISLMIFCDEHWYHMLMFALPTEVAFFYLIKQKALHQPVWCNCFLFCNCVWWWPHGIPSFTSGIFRMPLTKSYFSFSQNNTQQRGIVFFCNKATCSQYQQVFKKKAQNRQETWRIYHKTHPHSLESQ